MKFKEVRHIAHVAIIILAVIAAFLIVRSLSVDASFGQYGHYRGASIKERMNLPERNLLDPAIFQSVQTCLDCHEEESGEVWVGSDFWKEGKHASNACENCHSNCKQHVERMNAQPEAKEFVITRNTSDSLCLTCHTFLAARPGVLKPYDPNRKEHKEMKEDDKCISCHVPHYPGV